MRVGVNTGEVLVGALRAGGDYTALGDVVNTASRLQTTAAPGDVLVGPETHAATAGVVRYESRGLIAVRGREAPVEVWRAVQEVVPPGQRRARARAPLVGRDVELNLLAGALRNAVARSRVQLVLVHGEAGVGKTRLALELRGVAENDHQARVLLGHCVPYGEANVWFPIAETLQTYLGLDPASGRDDAAAACRTALTRLTDLDEDDPEVTRLVEGLLTMLGHVDDAVEPSRARDEAERAVLACFDAIASERPLVVALADLHWADDAVLQLVERLLSRLRGRPFVLFATARPELAARFTPKVSGYDALLLELEPLGADASAEMARVLLGGDAPQQLVDVLRERSGGNPFFIEELAAVLSEQEGGPVSEALRTVASVPPTLRGLVASRLDALDLSARGVLNDCAVVGPNGPVDVVVALGKEHSTADIRATLSRLADRDLIDIADGKFTFRSELVRDVAYNTLTKAERARRHLAVATHLAHWAEESERIDLVLEPLARHYGTAADLTEELGGVEGIPPDLDARAVDYLQRAANRAERQERWRGAAELLSVALKLVGPHDARRPDLLVARARARAEMRDLVAARADASAVLHDARTRDDRRGEAAARTVIGEIEHREGELVVAAATLDDAVERWRELGDRSGLAEALRAQGLNRMFLGELAEAELSIGEALELCRVEHDQRGEAWGLQNLAWIAFNAGDMAVAEQRLHESADAFAEIGDWGGVAWAFGLLAWVRWGQGRLDEAEALARQAFGRTGESGDPWASSMMLVLLANVALWRGQLGEAFEQAERARRRFVDIGNPWGELQATTAVALTLLAMGHVEEARARAERCGVLSTQVSDSMRAAASGLNSAIAVRLGSADALEVTHAAITEVGMGFDDHRLAYGIARLQAGLVEDAVASLEDALASSVRSGVRFAIAAALALAYAAADRPADALALQAETAGGAVTYLDRIQFALGRAFALLRTGAIEDACTAADEAVALADGTESRLEQAVTRLARAVVLDHIDRPGAHDANRDAMRRLDAIGIEAPGWRRAFALAAGS
jgi:predicted ATPase